MVLPKIVLPFCGVLVRKQAVARSIIKPRFRYSLFHGRIGIAMAGWQLDNDGNRALLGNRKVPKGGAKLAKDTHTRQ